MKLTRIPAFYRDPVWSPDSKRIVSLRQPRQARLGGTNGFTASGTGMDVVWIPAEGGDATLIVPADVAWSEGGVVAALPVFPRPPLPATECIERAAVMLRSGLRTAILMGGNALYGNGLAVAGRIAAET